MLVSICFSLSLEATQPADITGNMKIIKNEKLIKRNGKIGQWTSLGALVVLGLGMYISFNRTDLFAYSVAALLLGFTMTQVGMYMGNRYGRRPRPDEKLDAGLKGLQNEFVIYHYMTPASHLLVGPAGIWVVLPYHQRGQVKYSKNRWRMGGGGFLRLIALAGMLVLAVAGCKDRIEPGSVTVERPAVSGVTTMKMIRTEKTQLKGRSRYEVSWIFMKVTKSQFAGSAMA